MKIKHFLFDVFGFGLASFFTKCSGLLVVPILTRNLTSSEFGILEILLSFSGIASLFASLSLESYIARNWGQLSSQKEKKNLLSTLLSVVFILSSIQGFIVWILSDIVSSFLFGTKEFHSAVFLLFFSGLGSALCSLPLMVLRMERKILNYVCVIGLQSTFYILLIFWLFGRGEIRIAAVSNAMLVSSVLSVFLSAILVRSLIYPTIDFGILKTALRHSLPLLPAVVITWLNVQVDKYVLLYYFDAKTVGEFSVVNKITAIVSMGVMVFRQAWLPYSYNLARQADHACKEFNKVLKSYYAISLIFCSLVVSFSGYVISFLAPSNYEVENGILPILLLASIIYGSASIVNVGTMVSGKTEWNSYASLIGVIFNLSISLILVPIFGAHGAAWGTLMSSLIFMYVLSWRSAKETSIKFSYLNNLFFITIYIIISIYSQI